MENEVITPQIVDGSRQLAIEIKAQRDLAMTNPRNEAKVLDKALATLKFAPEFAEESYYSIPYKDKGEEVMVEGLSVVATREIVRLWGNCAIANRIVGETDDAFEVEGIMADFETNVFLRAVVRVPKTYIPKGTGIATPLRGDRMNTAIQAGLSKAERNAALKGIPAWFKERYFKEAKLIAGGKGKAEGKTVEQRKDALFTAFGKLGVEKPRVEAYIAAKWPADATNSDDMFGTMRGILNAIKEKSASADEVFAAPKAAEKAGAVKLGDIPGAGL